MFLFWLFVSVCRFSFLECLLFLVLSAFSARGLWLVFSRRWGGELLVILAVC